MTQVSRTQFKLDTATLYPDNTSGLISPADLRAQIDNIADSSPFIVTQKTSAPTSNDDSVGNGGNGSFGVGDIWIDEANQNIYVCVDDTALTAMWATVGGDLVVTRSGTTATNQIATWANGVEVQGASDFTYATGKLTINATTPVFEMDDSNATVDNQRWWTWIDGGVYKVQALTDAGIGGTSLLQVTRTGNAVGALELTTAGVVRTSLRQNNLLFSQENSTIATTTNHDLILGVNNQARLIIDNSGKMAVNGLGAATISFNIGNSNLTSGDADIKIGNARTSDGASFLDFITDPSVYPEYGLRLWKDAGENSASQLIHRGLGNLEILTTEAANIVLSTTGQPALTIDPSQAASFAGAVDVAGDVSVSKLAPSLSLIDTTNSIIVNTTAINPGTPVALFGTDTAHELRFKTDGASRMAISSTGNVGIGTNNPSGANLVINGETPRLRFNDVSAANVGDTEVGDAAWLFQLDDGNSVANSRYEFEIDGTLEMTLNSTALLLPNSYITAIKQINAQTGTTYTLALTDVNARVTMNNAAANTLTIPTNATVAFPVGTEIRILQIGAGATSIDADVGVTLNGISGGIGAMSGAGQYTDIIKVGTNTWWAVGDIGAVA